MVKWVYEGCISRWKKEKEDLKKLLYLLLAEGIHDNRWYSIYVSFTLGSSLEHSCYVTCTKKAFKDGLW